MTEQNTRRTRSSMANLGILLIVAGIVIIALQYIHIDMSWFPKRWTQLTWPLQIIIPGLALFVVGLVLPDRAGEGLSGFCLLYTSDAADDLLCVDLGGRRIIQKKQTQRAT